MKTRLLSLLLGLSLIFIGCSPDDAQDDLQTSLPSVENLKMSGMPNPSDITATSAKVHGEVTSTGNLKITERGACWATSELPAEEYEKVPHSNTGIGTFVVKLTDLGQNVKYYVRVYATNALGTAYSEPMTFTTLKLPVVETGDIIEVGSESASAEGTIIDFGGQEKILRYGICYWPKAADFADAVYVNEGEKTSPGPFASSLGSLTPATEYYFQAYATTVAGTGFGERKEFTTM